MCAPRHAQCDAKTVARLANNASGPWRIYYHAPRHVVALVEIMCSIPFPHLHSAYAKVGMALGLYPLMQTHKTAVGTCRVTPPLSLGHVPEVLDMKLSY